MIKITYIFKVKEYKNDGWFYADEINGLDSTGIYEVCDYEEVDKDV